MTFLWDKQKLENKQLSSIRKLFAWVKLTKHIIDIDKYKYSGYGIGFDRKGTFSIGNEFGRNCIIFGVDMSCSVYVDNKKKKILILGESPKQGFDDTILTAEKNIQLILLRIITIFF